MGTSMIKGENKTMGHFIGERSSLPNYKSYIDKLDKEPVYNAKKKELTQKGPDVETFDQAHVAGKVFETAVLTDFFKDHERLGKPVQLNLPEDVEYADIKRNSAFSFKYGGIEINITVSKKNASDVQTVDINVTDPAIKLKR